MLYSAMAKIDRHVLPPITGTTYPRPYDTPCLTRARQALGDAAGLTQFGVNLQRLPPGAWSSQRHWHSAEDEFVWILEGELVLVTDAGEQAMRAGDCAGFKAGVDSGHHFKNRSANPAVLLVVGSRMPEDSVVYPDIDLLWSAATGDTHKNGQPYEAP